MAIFPQKMYWVYTYILVYYTPLKWVPTWSSRTWLKVRMVFCPGFVLYLFVWGMCFMIGSDPIPYRSSHLILRYNWKLRKIYFQESQFFSLSCLFCILTLIWFMGLYVLIVLLILASCLVDARLQWQQKRERWRDNGGTLAENHKSKTNQSREKRN